MPDTLQVSERGGYCAVRMRPWGSRHQVTKRSLFAEINSIFRGQGQRLYRDQQHLWGLAGFCKEMQGGSAIPRDAHSPSGLLVPSEPGESGFVECRNSSQAAW